MRTDPIIIHNATRYADSRWSYGCLDVDAWVLFAVLGAV